MNKFNFKSLLALALTVMMVLSIVPMAVSAAEPVATKVTDASTLAVGDKIVLLNQAGTHAMGAQDGTKRAVVVCNAGNTVSVPTTFAVVTLEAGTAAGSFALKVSDGYLSFTGSKNQVHTTATVDATASWIIANADNGAVSIQNVADEARFLQYNFNLNQERFVCYKNTQENPVVFKLPAGAETPDAPEVPESKDPAADSTLTVKEAIALGSSKDHNTYTTGKYYVSGEITEVYNTQYGNMKIKDAEGNILTVYGTYSADGSTRYDAMATKPVAGDTVKVYGIIGQYNGTAQIKNGWIVEHAAGTTKPDPKPEVNDPAADSTLTVKEAIDLGASKEHNTYTAGKYYVSGEITEIYNTTYGNMKIKDADGNILTVYGTYSADGSTRFDAMDKQPAVGDTVKVYGIIGQYNGTAQIKNGWLVEVTSATPETPDTPVNPPKTGDALIVMIPALMLAGVAVLVVASRKRRFN